MAKQTFPSDHQDKFMLRLPDGMRDRIKAAADANNRSMNAEIVATLEDKYPAAATDLSARQMNDLVSFIQAATSGKEARKRIEEVNARISPALGRFVEGAASNGLSQVYFLPASSNAEVLRGLPAGYSRDDLAQLMTAANPKMTFEEAMSLLTGHIIQGEAGAAAALRKSTPTG